MSVPKRAADESLDNETSAKRPKEKQQSDLFKFFSSGSSSATASTSLPTRYVPGPFVPVSIPFRPKPYKPGEIPATAQDSTSSLFSGPSSNSTITPEMLGCARLPAPGPFVQASLPFNPAPAPISKISTGLGYNSGQTTQAHSQPVTAAKGPSQTTLSFPAKSDQNITIKPEPVDGPALPSTLSQPGAASSSTHTLTTGITIKAEPDTEPTLSPLKSKSPAEPVIKPPKTESSKPTLPDASKPPFYVIAAHAGAGVHPPELDSVTKASLRTSLSSPPLTDALSAVCSALAALETAPQLNAGVGSNLTLDGRVECDASLMCGETGAFGAVGALSGIPRPSEAARAVLEHSQLGDALGRVPPILLVGRGARDFALERGVKGCEKDEMITEVAKKDWEHWKSRWKDIRKKESEGEDGREVRDALAARQDTVGAVAFGFGDLPTLAAGVSSGGLLLKSPGRVGEAAIYGTGTWADERVAISVSGQGELIIQSALAKTIAEAIEDAGDEADVIDILQRVLVDGFYHKWRRRGEARPDAGVLVLHKEVGEDGLPMGRLYCAFTAPSIAIAYATSSQPKPKALILRNNTNTHTHGNDEKPPYYITQLPT